MPPLTKIMMDLDAQADAADDRAAFWLTVGTALTIWSRGTLPAPAWNPDNTPALRPLFAAHRKLGDALQVAVDARMYPV